MDSLPFRKTNRVEIDAFNTFDASAKTLAPEFGGAG